MRRPSRQIFSMLFGLGLAALLVFFLSHQLISAFRHNPGLNGAIVGVFLIGASFIFWQVIKLNGDITWVEAFRAGGAVTSYSQPRLLAPMAAMLRDTSRLSLSASAMRSLLDGVQARLDEGRDISRYFISLLILLGLLGTFWGLLGTINSVADAIRGLQVSGGDPANLFANLKQSLDEPLKGMGTAFSASLLGLSGSLILGYLDLQAGHAQNRFFTELEDWLSTQTRLSSVGGLAESDQPIPAYIQALLERTAENLDQMQRAIMQIANASAASESTVQNLASRLSVLVDEIQIQQQAMQRFMASQDEMRHVMARLGEAIASGSFGLDQASKTHLRNLDTYVERMSDDIRQGRAQTLSELRNEIKLLARTIVVASGSER